MVTTTDSLGVPVPGALETEPPEVPSGTTRVVMTAHISGTRDGREWPLPGEEIELPAGEAADLIRNFLARPAPEPEEAAVLAEEIPERAVAPRSRRRG